ncbi:MAG: GAF domain-containing protein [Deltaproteobacteria bacterium]|nr:GAF domain-containing protein [Deltaproteobacteria bacterium]
MHRGPHEDGQPEVFVGAVLDAMHEGLQVIGPGYQYLYVNQTVATQGRSTEDLLLGRTMMEAYPGIEHTEMFSILRATLEDRVARRFEHEHEHPDGTREWFELKFEPVPEGVAILSMSIGARRRAEDSARRTKRGLEVLSACNQALVRAQSEQSFAAELCRLLVDRGGYRASWIGMKNGDSSLRTAAGAGDDPIVDRVASSWGAVEPLEGPASRAVRTGLPTILRFIDMDPELAVWRDTETDRAFGSAICLPIVDHGRVLGALSICAEEPDAFDDEERALLAELVLDLGFGLTTLRERVESRQAVDALTVQRQRYQSLFEHTRLGIAHCEMLFEGDRPADFVYLDVNPSFYALTGLRQVVGRRVSEVIPGIRESDPGLFETYGRVVRSGVPEKFEVFLEALQQWFEVAVYSIESRQFVAVFDVITERKRIEQNLVTFSRRLERLATVVQDLSQARSLDAIVEVVRHTGRSLVGADGATFILREGDQCHYVDEDAIAPLWRGRRFPISACVSGWTMLNREAAVIADISKDPRVPQDAYRETFVRSLVIVPIRRESPIGAIGAYWQKPYAASPEDVRILQALADATSVAMDNVRVLRELEEGKARTRTIYDHLPNATLVWKQTDDGFVLVDFNERALAMSRGAVADCIGRAPASLGSLFPHLADDLTRSLETRSIVRREEEGRVPGTVDPSDRPGAPSSLRRLVLTYGFIPPDMVVLHCEDVTDQRATEEQLKLAQRLEAVGQLAGGVAHDFNNLLSVIISNAGFVASALPATDPSLADVIEIQDASQRAAALTRQLLAFSRKQILEPELIDVGAVVAGIVVMLSRLLGEDIEIEVHREPLLGNVLADPGQLEQVIMNLAVNARDAMPGGGTLRIKTVNVEPSPESEEHRAFVMLSVSDTGTGMDEATKSRIFEPFFTTKEKGKGTGLGLATVYGIVKQSGGHVRLHSELGRGTTFEVFLPRVDALSGDRKLAQKDSVLGTGTILVAEDEASVRRAVVRILEGSGYRVLAAASGEEALDWCSKERGNIDLLLTDVVMPRMSGRELAERIGAQCPKLRVVFMSGYTDDAIVRHGVDSGGTHFISKPFTASELTRKVREALEAPDRGSS